MPATHKDYLVWHKSMDLVVMIYKLFDGMPSCEKYALIDQMRRAAISVPSNIAEGHGRNSNKDFLKFLYIARGSLCELQTQLELCERLSYFTEEQLKDVMNSTIEVSKMLNSLMKKVGEKIK